MPRFFNTTGPCNPVDHYMLPPETRLVGAHLSRYVENKLYWVLHAPRQTGKTTFLQSWMKELNASGQAIACYVSVERCQEFPRAEDAIPAICDAIQDWAVRNLGPSMVPGRPEGEVASLLERTLSEWAALVAPKPLVVLFDEVDVLQDQALVSFLRQLRGGFATRGIGLFPVSVALVGMRDLRDYLVRSKDGVPLNIGAQGCAPQSGTPQFVPVHELPQHGCCFNIKEDSSTLSNFTREDIRTLVDQHFTDSGQAFSPEAGDRIWELTRGQPWLTNALCKKCVWTPLPQGRAGDGGPHRSVGPRYLAVFDRTPAGRSKTWEERLTREERVTPGGKVTVVSG